MPAWEEPAALDRMLEPNDKGFTWGFPWKSPPESNRVKVDRRRLSAEPRQQVGRGRGGNEGEDEGDGAVDLSGVVSFLLSFVSCLLFLWRVTAVWVGGGGVMTTCMLLGIGWVYPRPLVRLLFLLAFVPLPSHPPLLSRVVFQGPCGQDAREAMFGFPTKCVPMMRFVGWRHSVGFFFSIFFSVRHRVRMPSIRPIVVGKFAFHVCRCGCVLWCEMSLFFSSFFFPSHYFCRVCELRMKTIVCKKKKKRACVREHCPRILQFSLFLTSSAARIGSSGTA